MKPHILQFRVFDTKTKKYLTSESKVYIGLDGKFVTSEGADKDDRYDLSYSLPYYDVNGRKLFTDDGLISISNGSAVYAVPHFDEELKQWVGLVSIGGYINFSTTSFEILPNGEEIINGNTGVDIQLKWERMADETRVPKHVPATLEEVCAIPVNDWMQYEASRINTLGESTAPAGWSKIPTVLQAYPHQAKVDKALHLVEGTTNVVVWKIKRNNGWTLASDFFVVIKKKAISDEATLSQD